MKPRTHPGRAALSLAPESPIWLIFLATVVFVAGGVLFFAFPEDGFGGSVPMADQGGPDLTLMTFLFGVHGGLILAVLITQGRPSLRTLSILGVMTGGMCVVTFNPSNNAFPGHVVVAAAGAACLLPWISHRLAVLGRNATTMIAAGSAIAVLGIQLILHVALVIPSTHRYFNTLTDVRGRIEATASPAEIATLSSAGAFGLTVAPSRRDAEAYSSVDHAGWDEIVTRRASLERDRPRVLRTWEISGRNRNDRTIWVYDGRAEATTPQFWVIPARALSAERYLAKHAYARITSASLIAWMTLVVLVFLSHGRRRKT